MLHIYIIYISKVPSLQFGRQGSHRARFEHAVQREWRRQRLYSGLQPGPTKYPKLQYAYVNIIYIRYIYYILKLCYFGYFGGPGVGIFPGLPRAMFWKQVML